MALYALRKKILSFSPKPAEFLQGLSSNVWDAPQNAFLDVRGRIVATAHQLRVSDDEVWEVVEEPFAERLEKHLAKYLVVSETRIRGVVGVRAYFDLAGDHPLAPGDRALEERRGRIVLCHADLEASVTEEEFTRFRLDYRIPVQGKDYDEEMLLNLDDERYVSYSKGCFLGQEIIARVRYRGKPPSRLEVMEAKEGDPRLPRLTSRLFDPARSSYRGFYFAPERPKEAVQ
jgi:folate-binding protein YgfZ